jgi:hypothetical protein
MGKGFNINIKNNKEIRDILRILPDQARENAFKIIDEEFKVAEGQAKSNAQNHTAFGNLANGIKAYRKGEQYFFVSTAEHSAFVEFGIRLGFKNNRPEFSSFAARYKGISTNPLGLSAMTNIYAWAIRRGIDKKYWYPIYRKLTGNPIKEGSKDGRTPKTGFYAINDGKGFFLGPYISARDKVRKRLRTLLKRSVK